MNDEEFLTMRQAMAVFACTRRCIQKRAARGEIRAVLTGRGRGNQSVFAFRRDQLPAGWRDRMRAECRGCGDAESPLADGLCDQCVSVFRAPVRVNEKQGDER